MDSDVPSPPASTKSKYASFSPKKEEDKTKAPGRRLVFPKSKANHSKRCFKNPGKVVAERLLK